MDFCEQVLLRCVGRANLEPLADRWRAYTQSLAELAKKLSVQYNIETIIGPIDVQISEAIMNFQENAENITNSVYLACADTTKVTPLLDTMKAQQPGGSATGSNRLSKREAPPKQAQLGTTSRRSAGSLQQAHQWDNGEQSYAGHNFQMEPNRINRNNGAPASQVVAQPSLFGGVSPLDDAPLPLGLSHLTLARKSPTLLNEIRDYILSVRNFWSLLPNSVCNATLGPLWGGQYSGSRVGSLTSSQQQASCFQEPLTVSDMNSDLRYRTEIQGHIQRLNVMHAKIVDALQGKEIEWAPASSSTGGASGAPGEQLSANKPQGGLVNGQVARPPFASSQSTATMESSEFPEEEEPEDPLDVSEENGSGGDIEEDANDPGEEEYENVTESANDSDMQTQQNGNENGGESPALPTTNNEQSNESPANSNDLMNGKPNDVDLNVPNEFISPDTTSPYKSSGAASQQLVVILPSAWLACCSALLFSLFLTCSFSFSCYPATVHLPLGP